MEDIDEVNSFHTQRKGESINPLIMDLRKERSKITNLHIFEKGISMSNRGILGGVPSLGEESQGNLQRRKVDNDQLHKEGNNPRVSPEKNTASEEATIPPFLNLNYTIPNFSSTNSIPLILNTGDMVQIEDQARELEMERDSGFNSKLFLPNLLSTNSTSLTLNAGKSIQMEKRSCDVEMERENDFSAKKIPFLIFHLLIRII